MNNIDMILLKPEIRQAAKLSDATIWREQRAGRFPPFEHISERRVGIRQSHLQQWLDGRRNWGESS